MQTNDWVKINTKVGKFVAHVERITDLTITLRTGLNTKMIISPSDVIDCAIISGRDIETRKNGKYYTF